MKITKAGDYRYLSKYHGTITIDSVLEGDVILPNIINDKEKHTGKGLVIRNCMHLRVKCDVIKDFEIGVELMSDCIIHPRREGYGTVHNTIDIRMLHNNKINIHLLTENDGWVNQNRFVDSRCYHASNNPENDKGFCQILFTHNSTQPPIDNNTFVNMCLEGNSAYYIVDALGKTNYFINCRWEKPGSQPRVRFRISNKSTKRNVIDGGYHLEKLIIEQDLFNTRCEIRGQSLLDKLRIFLRIA